MRDKSRCHSYRYRKFCCQHPMLLHLQPRIAFLFTLTKIATGYTNEKLIVKYFGGDYARWSYGYRWVLCYRGDRYINVIGHQGLLRYVKDFPRFNAALERHVQMERIRFNTDDCGRIIPGLEFLPVDIFGPIDDSIERTSTPFLGPSSYYEGAISTCTEIWRLPRDRP